MQQDPKLNSSHGPTEISRRRFIALGLSAATVGPESLSQLLSHAPSLESVLKQFLITQESLYSIVRPASGMCDRVYKAITGQSTHFDLFPSVPSNEVLQSLPPSLSDAERAQFHRTEQIVPDAMDRFVRWGKQFHEIELPSRERLAAIISEVPRNLLPWHTPEEYADYLRLMKKGDVLGHCEMVTRRFSCIFKVVDAVVKFVPRFSEEGSSEAHESSLNSNECEANNCELEQNRLPNWSQFAYLTDDSRKAIDRMIIEMNY